MPHTKPNFHHHPIILLLALFLVACLSSRQATARPLLQNNDRDPTPQQGLPAMGSLNFNKPRASLTFPAFHRPLLPPRYLPILPFPSLPTIPSIPTLPSQPTPTGPTIPSFPTVPIPGIPSGTPPSVNSPPAKLVSDNPSKTPSIKNP